MSVPAGRVCRSELRVRYAETDQMGVVYHSNYLIWCEIGRTDLIRELGMPYAEMERQGVALAVSEATVRYQGAARYDDRIVVETRIADVRSRTVTFDYQIRSADTGARLATASTVLVSLDRSGRTTVMPEHIRRLLESARD
jgi:acyl-CoA thioester hydrolase